MTRHKYTDLICIIIVVTAVIITTVIASYQYSQGVDHKKTMQYENKLFDTQKVHTIDIKIDQSDWNKIQENASKKEYQKCDVVIDGKTFQNVAIRAKGNSSLSSVTRQGSERYSFKIEFDHYNKGSTCWGLDKLSLNNIIQDTTYMKDYLSYTLMREMGADAPLCSYINVKVNGEDFGLYLAVEGVEESFVQRNFGSDYGNLYKPEASDGVANMGNRNFNNANGYQDFMQNYQVFNQMKKRFQMQGDNNDQSPNIPQQGNEAQSSNNTQQGNNVQSPNIPQQGNNIQNPDTKLNDKQVHQPNFPQNDNNASNNQGYDNNGKGWPGGGQFGGARGAGGGFGGMSGNASDVALKYTDNQISSYINIFDNAILDASDQDKKRLISSIKQMNTGKNLEEVLNTNEILRYFVVHNFVDNYDSYTGNMLHNYYLYEKDGKISMIAWDYNLAFGGFGMGRAMGQNFGQNSESATDSATTYVNYPIDTPVSGTTMEERPLLNSLLSNKEYLNQYHELFDEFISKYFESGYCDKLIDSVSNMIEPYVKKDKTAFYTVEDFNKGVKSLKEFCDLRAESIRGQLKGTIPSTSDGQKNTTALIDASSINMQDLGSAGMGGGNFQGDNFRGNNQNNNQNNVPYDYSYNKGINNIPDKSDTTGKNDKNTTNQSNGNTKGRDSIDYSNIIFGIFIIIILLGLICLKYRNNQSKNNR